MYKEDADRQDVRVCLLDDRGKKTEMSSYRLLLIDESEPDRALYRRYLSKEFQDQVQLLEAASGREGLEQLQKDQVDCVLLCEPLSDSSSLELMASLAPEQKADLSIIVVTQAENEPLALSVLKAGALDCLPKNGLDGSDLYRAVRNALGLAEMRRIIAEQRETLEGIKKNSAEYDEMTELPNRKHFRQQLTRALSRAERSGGRTGVMLIGLDGFKDVNSTMGHDLGDEILAVVGKRLGRCFRDSDLIARWGGDEFAVLLDAIKKPEDPVVVAQRIMYSLSRSFTWEQQELYVTSSIGIAAAPDDGTDVESLLQHAARAMYRVKQAGGNNYELYSDQIDVKPSNRLTLASRLKGALKRDEFVLFYQPQIDIRSGRVVGLEALIRWRDKEKGFRSPAEFIPALEETGLIVPVGEWVLQKACTQARAWQYAGLPDLRVSVNLSAKQFRQPSLVKMIRRILQETGLEPTTLELELTESVLMVDQDNANNMLHKVRDMGSLVALDDFGTGYSSLAFLKDFPVNTLKIDRAFIQDICEDPDDRAICTAIVTLANALRLQVVAEGVETVEQMAELSNQGCHLIQGFLFARPMPPEEVWHWLTEEAPVLLTAAKIPSED